MTTSIPIPPPGFDDLSIEQQIEYVQLLWDRIAADPSRIPVPDWHREILDERLKAYRERPDVGATCDKAKE
jgi:putative addiction module component (TIGR02574 family)